MDLTGQTLTIRTGRYLILRPTRHSSFSPCSLSFSLSFWGIFRRKGKSLLETCASVLFAQDEFYTAQGPDAPSSFRHLGGSTRVWEDTQSWVSLEQLWLSNL